MQTSAAATLAVATRVVEAMRSPFKKLGMPGAKAAKHGTPLAQPLLARRNSPGAGGWTTRPANPLAGRTIMKTPLKRLQVALAALLAVAASGTPTSGPKRAMRELDADSDNIRYGIVSKGSTSIWDAFRSTSEVDIEVNKYLWTASLEVLSFLLVGTALSPIALGYRFRIMSRFPQVSI
eukprot:scaffold1267_cov171-Amphora_coffeaeformis.AAC.27